MRDAIIRRFLETRAATEALAAPLSAEDQGLQAFADASPTKWHRAHTTWFFDTFVLAPRGLGTAPPGWSVLFNSYYEAVGPRHARPQRGLLSRPSVDEIAAWRRAVDGRVLELLQSTEDVVARVELGIAHEEQHQELLLTDILAAFALNPLRPAVRAPAGAEAHPTGEARFVTFEGGLVEIGHAGDGFAFDNEGPRHRFFLEPFGLADRLVTVRELRAFMDAGGYRTPSLWMSEGFAWAQAHGVEAPGYVRAEGGALVGFTLEGERALADEEPVAHVSWYEADALARFLGARLPTEQEWEHAAAGRPVTGRFRDDDAPGLYGDRWVWTRSAYAPYPGYRAADGALGEYNGKFMASQLVLRGGSVLTNRAHLRASYRNFWPAPTRFQMTGVRLARDLTR